MVNDTVNEIKQKLSIVDLVSRYVSLKKSGNNYKGSCPFHGENTPSLMVSPELQIFKCFGCGEGGDIFSFFQKIEGVDFHDSLVRLGEMVGVEVSREQPDYLKGKNILYQINEASAEFYNFLLVKHPAGKPGLDYLTGKRRLDLATIDSFSLGYAPKQWDLLYQYLLKKKFLTQDMLEAGVILTKSSGQGFIDRFRGRVMFPFTGIDGKVLGFNGRTIFDEQPKYVNTSSTKVFNKSAFLYGLNIAKVDIKKHGILLVEGQMDVITAFKYGIKHVVASSGTALTSGQLKILARYSNTLVFCYDSDNAGVMAIHRGIELAEKEGFEIYVSPMPAKYTDLDQFLNDDPAKAKEVVSTPVPFYDFVISMALSRHDKHSYLGKNQILQDVAPYLSKTQNPVIFDSNVKTLSESLDLSEDVVKQALTSPSAETKLPENKQTGPTIDKAPIYDKTSEFPLEEYMLALIIKAPLGTAQALTYKLAKKDFSSEILQSVFTELKSYLIGRKRKIDINHFVSRFDDQVAGLLKELYLTNLGKAEDDDSAFLLEVEKTFKRLKKEKVKKELKEVAKKIKEAEKDKNSEELKDLLQRFKQLSGRLA